MDVRDEASVREVIRGLRDREEPVRVAAADALAALQPASELAVVELGRALNDDVPAVVNSVAGALGRFGARAASTERQVLAAMHVAMVDCNYSLLDALLTVLRQSVPDAGQSINDFFMKRSPEFRQMAIDALYAGDDSGIIYDDQS